MSYYVIIRGPLGIGKSTVSAQIARRLSGAHISVDKILDENNLTDEREEGYISQRSFFRANELAAEQAKGHLDKDVPVVFDGNFYWKSQVEDLLHRLPHPHHVFTLKAPVEVCIARDEERGRTHGEIAARVVHKKTASFDYGYIIDTTRKSADQTVDAVLAEIRREKP